MGAKFLVDPKKCFTHLTMKPVAFLLVLLHACADGFNPFALPAFQAPPSLKETLKTSSASSASSSLTLAPALFLAGTLALAPAAHADGDTEKFKLVRLLL